jgi:acyl-CoA dehydrogenase
MDFSFSANNKQSARRSRRLRLVKDQTGGFPHDFHRARAEQGWLAIPQAYGGSGLGVTEAAVMMHDCPARAGQPAADSLLNAEKVLGLPKSY